LALYMAMRSRIDPVRVGNVRSLISGPRSASSPPDFLHEPRLFTTSVGRCQADAWRIRTGIGFREIASNASIRVDPAAIR